VAKVLFVNLEGRIGGAETSLLLLLRHLHKYFCISVACPGESPLASRLSEGKITIVNLPKLPRQRCFQGIAYFAITIFRMIRIVYRLRPKIIHANNFHAIVICVLPAFITGRKLLWHARDMSRFRLVSRICGFFCERIIAVSNSVKNLLIEQGINPTKIDVVYNGTKVNSISGQKAIKTKLNNGPIRFTNVGQFVPWKKQTLFVEAACLLTRKDVKAEFYIIGDDIFKRDYKYKVKLLNMIRNCAAPEKFTLLGWQGSMEEMWNKVDCLVHTADREPFGRVIIEAMAHKIPVIAVNDGGPREIIQNGETGILVNPDDAEALGEAMLRIAQNKELARRLAESGYERVISDFSAEKTAENIRRIYNEVLAA
jgi:glycosyltransferase involved in cell wall biosynthesis